MTTRTTKYRPYRSPRTRSPQAPSHPGSPRTGSAYAPAAPSATLPAPDGTARRLASPDKQPGSGPALGPLWLPPLSPLLTIRSRSRTKCRRLFQDAAAAAYAQRTSGNSQLGKIGGCTRLLPYPDRRAKPGIGSRKAHLRGQKTHDRSGAGNGSAYKTVSCDTARVSATYSRCRPLVSAPAICAGSTTMTWSYSSPLASVT